MVHLEASVADPHSHNLSSVTAGSQSFPSGRRLFFISLRPMFLHCAADSYYSNTVVVHGRGTLASFEIMTNQDLLDAFRRQEVPIHSFTNHRSLLELVQCQHLLSVHAVLATAVAQGSSSSIHLSPAVPGTTKPGLVVSVHPISAASYWHGHSQVVRYLHAVSWSTAFSH
jgi:hypothetical protein